MTTVTIKTNPNLLRAIERTVDRQPSAAELQAQRISFVFGSLGNKSSVTRAQVQNVLDKQNGLVPA